MAGTQQMVKDKGLLQVCKWKTMERSGDRRLPEVQAGATALAERPSPAGEQTTNLGKAENVSSKGFH